MSEITCRERERRFDGGSGWVVESSLTDLLGTFGEPRIETTWSRGAERLRDVRHPSPDGGEDVARCEHYYWVDGVRAPGDDEPWSDIVDDATFFDGTVPPEGADDVLVRRRQASPWEPVPETGDDR